MPELPEVETVRAGLEPVLRGRRFVRVEQRRKDLRFPLPERFAERLTGRRCRALDRRAKYILVHLDRGEVLAVHLGMTGRFSVSCRAPRSPPPPRQPHGGERRLHGVQLGEYTYEHGHDAKHDHLVFTMSGGAVVTYNDARRFGYMTLIPTAELEQDAFFRGLGVEPLGDDLNAAYLARRALRQEGRPQGLPDGPAHRRRPRQHLRVRGAVPRRPRSLEAGRRASPPRPASRRPPPSAWCRRSRRCSPTPSAPAAPRCATTSRPTATLGSFQNEFAVYGREGEPCARPGCRGTVRRKTQGGRSTFYCPACQR